MTVMNDVGCDDDDDDDDCDDDDDDHHHHHKGEIAIVAVTG